VATARPLPRPEDYATYSVARSPTSPSSGAISGSRQTRGTMTTRSEYKIPPPPFFLSLSFTLPSRPSRSLSLSFSCARARLTNLIHTGSSCQCHGTEIRFKTGRRKTCQANRGANRQPRCLRMLIPTINPTCAVRIPNLQLALP
jgi:hypothetical protein